MKGCNSKALLREMWGCVQGGLEHRGAGSRESSGEACSVTGAWPGLGHWEESERL